MIKLEVIQPDKVKIQQEVDHVIIPGSEGYFGVYEGHTPFLTKIQPGVLTVYPTIADDNERYAIHDGFVMVEQTYIRIICEVIEKENEIDAKRAEAAKKRAEDRLKAAKENINFERARLSLKRSFARLEINTE